MQRIWNNQTTLKKNRVGGVTLPDFKANKAVEIIQWGIGINIVRKYESIERPTHIWTTDLIMVKRQFSG